jgi:hypothetical protein
MGSIAPRRAGRKRKTQVNDRSGVDSVEKVG